MVKKVALIVGGAFLLFGALGFVPGATSDIDGVSHLFGVFMTGALQGALYLTSGVVGLLAASSERYSRWYLQIFGIMYALLAVLGAAQGDTILGAIGVSMGSNILHGAIALLLLIAGFALPVSTDKTMTLQRPTKDKPAM